MADELVKLKVRARRVHVDANTIVRRSRVRLGQARKRFQERDAVDPRAATDGAEAEGPIELRHLPATATPEQLSAELARAGAVVVDNLVEREVMDRVLAEMGPYIDATPTGADDYSGRNTKRTGGVIARSETGRELVQHPTVLGTVERTLTWSPSYQLNLTQIISVGSGEPAQKIHRDQWTFGDHPFAEGHEVQCSTIWALDDFTDDNGATRVIPGSNHAAERLKYRFKDTVPVEMTKGSVLLYTGRVYHGGGRNQTSTVRRGLNLTYIVGWLRQEENQYLSVPHDLAETLPTELLELIGYKECGISLGFVDDRRSPLSVLDRA